MNKILVSLVLAAMTVTASAQSGSSSPYSQYGFGDLADQGVGFNKGMNGVGIGMRLGNEINPMNPASYSAVDSLSMLFDAGLSGQITHFKENGTSLNVKNGGFDYVAGLFRVWKNVGVSFGMLPYSNIGFNYSSTETEKLGKDNISVYNTYEGNGGLNQLFIGAGWNIIKPLSVGFNVAYLWGDINKTIQTGTSSISNTLYKKYEASVSNYKIDFGLQYIQPIGAADQLTVGATFSPGHNLKTDAVCRLIMSNSTVSRSDTTSFTAAEGFSLPTTYALGVGYRHGSTFRAGADFHMQKWGSVEYPDFTGNAYVKQKGLLKDAYRFNAGAEWTPRIMSRKFLERVRYRAGIGYATPYYYINGQDGPKEFSASLGFGIPIMNGWNNRSVLNISGQYVRRSADGLISENTFRINIGLTFNERWFAKWKVE